MAGTRESYLTASLRANSAVAELLLAKLEAHDPVALAQFLDTTFDPDKFASADGKSNELGITPVHVPLYEVNAFFGGQARRNYEEDKLLELAGSFQVDKMMHPVTIAELPPEEAVGYIDGINTMWGRDYALEDITQNPNGNYYIVIAGHRRTLASLLVADWMQQNGQSGESIKITANIHSHITLLDALRKQISENTHQQVAPSDEAYAIRQFFDRAALSKTACAHELGLSLDKIRNAVDYIELPIEVRKLVETNIVSYTRSLTLIPLLRRYRELQIREGVDTIYTDAYITNSLCIVLANAYKHRWSTDMIRTDVRERVEALDYVQLDINELLTGSQLTPEEHLSNCRAELEQHIRRITRFATRDAEYALAHYDEGLASGGEVNVAQRAYLSRMHRLSGYLLEQA